MGLPVLASLLITVSSVLSLVTIISDLSRGRYSGNGCAPPAAPADDPKRAGNQSLILTAATLALMVLAGKRYYPIHVHVPLFGFTIALLISTLSILSIGFLIASIVSDGALCATDRRQHFVSHDRCLGKSS